MFGFKTKEKKIFDIFKILLYKDSKEPMQLSEADILKIYERATEIFKTVDQLESIYSLQGKIDVKKLTE